MKRVKIEARVAAYQIVIILEGVVEGGNPLGVPVDQHVSLLSKACRLKKTQNRFIKGVAQNTKTLNTIYRSTVKIMT